MDGGRPAKGGVRLEARKVYDLIDAVGEAVVGQGGLAETVGAWRDPEAEATARTATVLTDRVEAQSQALHLLQEQAMALAMLPVRSLFGPLPRLVRNLCRQLGKEARLELHDAGTALDKQVLDRISEPLWALLINALDHGIEAPGEREAAGKAPEATISLTARQQGGQVHVEVADDGRGVDVEAVRRTAAARGLVLDHHELDDLSVLDLLCRPGFTTAARTTETSGRGVGLDLVRRAVEDVKGGIELETVPGVGTRFLLTLPATLTIVEGVLLRTGGGTYAVPVAGIEEVVGLREFALQRVGGALALDLRGDVVAVLGLADVLDLPDAGLPGGDGSPEPGMFAVVLAHGGRRLALRVDGFLGRRELVVKSLGTFLTRVRHVAGAAVLADGDVVLVLDPVAILETFRAGLIRRRRPALEEAAATTVTGTAPPRVLVVDDAFPIREMVRSILESAGYDVDVAKDGAEALRLLAQGDFDGVVTDVEMPNVDGFELCAEVRRGDPGMPVVMVTARVAEEDHRRGLEVGADAYLLKAEFDQGVLVDTVRRLVGR